MRVTDYDGFLCRFEKGVAVSSAICDRYGRYIRRGELWYGSSRLLGDGDEWADGTPEKAKYPDPCYSLDELLERYPLLREYATAIIPSARSLHESRPFKCRIDFNIWTSDNRQAGVQSNRDSAITRIPVLTDRRGHTIRLSLRLERTSIQGCVDKSSRTDTTDVDRCCEIARTCGNRGCEKEKKGKATT